MRLARLNVEALSDEQLVAAYNRASAFAMYAVARRLSEAIVGRPTLDDSDVRLHAFATLARTEVNFPRALEYIELGRRAAAAKKQSSASWDLIELSLYFAAHDGNNVVRMVDHLQKQHINEPGVAAAVTRMLVDAGLLHPDGTPAFGPHAAEPDAAAAEPPQAEASGLWTPDSAQSGGGKLWTPG